MQGLIERYMKSSRGTQPEPAAIETQPDMVCNLINSLLIIQINNYIECMQK
jgi:TctA family transporter